MTINQPKLDGSIVGELLLGELPEWQVGVCTVTADDDDRDLYVYGESGQWLGTVMGSTHIHRPNGVPLIDLESMADSVNAIVEKEHRQL